MSHENHAPCRNRSLCFVSSLVQGQQCRLPGCPWGDPVTTLAMGANKVAGSLGCCLRKRRPLQNGIPNGIPNGILFGVSHFDDVWSHDINAFSASQWFLIDVYYHQYHGTEDVQFIGTLTQVQKSKEAKMKAAMAGGKSRKKKWAKGKAPGKLGRVLQKAGGFAKSGQRRANRRRFQSPYTILHLSLVMNDHGYRSSGYLLMSHDQ